MPKTQLVGSTIEIRSKEGPRWPLSILVASVAIAAVSLGLWTAVRELSPLSYDGGDAQSRLLALTGEPIEVGFSTESQNALLSDCTSSFTFFAVPNGTPPDDQAAIARNCLRVAESISSVSPAHGYAYAVAAYAGSFLNDSDLVNMNLAYSYLVAPKEAWIAYWRVVAGERVYASLDSTVATQHSSDLGTLIKAAYRMSRLIFLYARDDAAFRERLEEALSDVSAEEQRRFLDYLRVNLGPINANR